MDKLLYILWNISDVMKEGKSLNNAKGWVNRAHGIAALTVIVTFILTSAKMFGFDLGLSEEDISNLVKGIDSVGIGVISIIHHASNKEAGG